MFWVMDSEMVIGDRPNELAPTTAGTWKDRKDSMEFMTGRTWHYHGMNDFALRTRSSVLHRFWRDNISDKNGRRSNIPPNTLAALAVPKATFSFAMTAIDKVEGRNEEVGGVKIRCEYVDLHQSRNV